MSNAPAPRRYHAIHVTLHWLVALLVFFLLFLGLYEFPRTPNAHELNLLSIHRTVGIVLGIVLVIRLISRYVFPRPEASEAGTPFLNFLTRAVHFALYIGLFTMMFTGDSLGQAYGLQSILGGNGQVPDDLFIYPQRIVHGTLAYILVALIVLHILAALYHQFVLRDNLIARMWYGDST